MYVYRKIKENYKWSNIKGDIKRLIQSCQINKHNNKISKAPMEITTTILNKNISQGVCPQIEITNAKSIVKVVDGKELTTILNTQDKRIRINKIQLNLEPFNENTSFIFSNSKESKTNRLNVLRNNLGLDHLNSEEKHSILNLCTEYSDIFYLPNIQLTCTNLLKHEIKVNDPIDENIITYSRAVNGTCIQIARLLSENNQVTKIGANIGWHSLYENVDNISKMFNKQKLNFQRFYIPLVTLARVKPTEITKTEAVGSEYLFISFSLINDLYNMTKKKSTQTKLLFLPSVCSRLAMLKVFYSAKKASAISKVLCKVCFKKMRHGKAIDQKILDAADEMIKAIKDGTYDKAVINEKTFDIDTIGDED